MGGEGCAAHTDDTGLPDDADQLLRGQGIDLSLGSGLDVGAQGILMIIFDDHRHHGRAIGVWGRLSTALTLPDTEAWMGTHSPWLSPIF